MGTSYPEGPKFRHPVIPGVIMTHLHRASLSLFLAAAALLWAACSGGEGADGTDGGPIAVDTGGGGGDGDEADGDGTGDAGLDGTGSTDDVEGSGDTGGDDDVTGGDAPDIGEPLPFGEPCTLDAECEGRVCLRIAAGLDQGFCSGFCLDVEDCPPNEWDCVFVANSGTDAAFLCVPNDLCIDGDADEYGLGPGCRGPDCDDERDTVHLGADEVCDGVDNDCDGNIDDNPVNANVDCNTGFPGVCAEGRALCLGGLLDCVQNRPSIPEICDALDNDCNGLPDDGPDGGPLQEECYGASPDTLGVGQCAAGVRACFDGITTDCVGQVLPFPEICDGLDNDCDGRADEGEPGEGVVCDTGLEGLCAAGTTVCDGGDIRCVARAEPTDEICDGFDNDCNGLIDDDEEGLALTRSCYTGDPETRDVGTCHGGTATCIDGEYGRCEDEVIPTIELCSTADEDCDGVVNNGSPASGFLCETGAFGLCAFGQTECGEGGAPGTACIPDFVPEDEICDGFDNDCDDEVDEDEAGDALLRSCYDGPFETRDVGLCSSGEQTCAFGDWGGCVGQHLPAFEICDGFDNDCDGTPDDGNPGGGIPCTTGSPGICNLGVTECRDGAIVCAETRTAEAEVCDGLDNDCDGSTDEDAAWATLGTGCLNGLGICRRAGVFVCDPTDPEGAPVCSADPGATEVEVCDGLDNDCDGDTDEGVLWGDLGVGCISSQGECAAAGVMVCDVDDPDGALVCSGPAGDPTTEVCDGRDNDCDGAVDENAIWSDLGDVCTNGEGVCVRAGIFVCDEDDRGGPPACNAVIGDSSTEVCDGLDNDCDGSTDEGALWTDLGLGCTESEGECMAAGVMVCDSTNPSGVLVCSGEPGEPGPEICDGLDNDCDGEVDEDATWDTLGTVCVSGIGVCQRAGVHVCNPADRAGDPICNATPGDIETEICDGLDNDCDGSTDENPVWDDLGTGCLAGDGICRAAGVLVCDPDDRAGDPICSATPGPSDTEVCDGLDNDCDGSVDEGGLWSTVGNVCTSGVGICERAGVLVCNASAPAGPPTCSAEPGPSATEICDGLDNDCDESIDENETWSSLGEGCTSGVGECRAAGVLVCDPDDRGGDPVCSATAGDPTGELCDGLDNDCDDAVDEDFDGLGTTCFAGLGICRAAGIVVCDGTTATRCDAEAGTPEDEDELACDYLDDDCDGAIDEDFITGGLYRGVENCGGCGVDCNGLWDGGPGAFHVVPTCDVVLGVASCGYGCEADWHDLDRDPANGCEFTPDDGAVYVATPANGGADGGSCGTWDSPCATIDYAVTNRASPTTRPRLLVSDGLYRETVTLRDGVSILGGHNSVNWLRNAEVNVSAITGLNTATDNAAVSAVGITSATEFSGFTVSAAPGRTGGGNSYGIYVSGSDGDLLISDNVVFANSGGDGTAGAVGSSGANGEEGSSGNSSEIRGSCTGSIAGGVPGTTNCDNPSGGGSTDTDGGTGGTSTCPSFGVQTGSGGTGSGPSPGSGGAGAFSMLGSGSSCFVAGSVDPSPGGSGSPGTDGGGGSGATDGSGAVSGGRWSGASGTSGSVGGHGSGGGGGGAAAGVETTGSDYFGATGGGGGAGGCAAGAGGTGSAGGGSFAIFVTFSSARTSSTQMPVITGNTLTRGQGGRGGSGGNGGAGGEPGAGSSGGTGVNSGTYGFCMLDGAVGAEGGRGGHGGGGGGGGGGVSFDLFAWNANGHDPGYSGNTFGLAGGTATGGDGGSGGTSNNTDNVGGTGTDGLFGNIRFDDP